MSPEAARAVRDQTACTRCHAGVGQPCRTERGVQLLVVVHQARVHANLFRRNVSSKEPTPSP